MKIILYDDFNHELRPPDIIGTIRQTFGAWAFTNGWKIIEVYETTNLHDRPDMEIPSKRPSVPPGGVSPTLCCGAHNGVQPKINDNMAKIYRIRKLTPRECFRLMGVSDADIDKIQNYPLVTTDGKDFTAPDGLDMKDLKRLTISESQQYKMAGNSIVVQVLEAIFTQLFKDEQDTLF